MVVRFFNRIPSTVKHTLMNNNVILNEITISANDSIDANVLNHFYSEDVVQMVLTATLAYMNGPSHDARLELPYFADMDNEIWCLKPKALDIYITDSIEGLALNLEARGKNYPTNILSYPSEMNASIIDLMPNIPLGELIICHDVIIREAAEQHKTLAQHITHLLVHGILHLFGFDHMLGHAEQEEMERFEIAILANLAIPNPYL